MRNLLVWQPALLTILLFWFTGCVKVDDLVQQVGQPTGLSQGQIATGLKEALRVGSDSVVSRLGRQDGFNRDSIAHISLPGNLTKVQNALNNIGYSKYLDDLELRLNRAAEQVTPRAKRLFISAIQQLTWDDVKRIYHGPDDAATRYFQQKMSAPLKKDMYPVISRSLSEVGAIQSYDRMMRKYRSIPLVPDIRADLTGYTLDKTLDAVFYYLAKEEAAIRKEPAKRTTAILRQVFGGH